MPTAIWPIRALPSQLMRFSLARVTLESSRWIQGGVGPADWQRQLELRARHGDSVLLTFGLHPWWVASHSDTEVANALAALPAALKDAVALGELGLDFHPQRAPSVEQRQRQTEAFSAQLAIAKPEGRPIVLHVVRAHLETLNILTEADHRQGGLVHSFSGTVEQGRAYIARGFLLSLSGGGLTSQKRRRLYAALPRDRIVIETDAPDQLPRDWIGEINEPSHLPAIADAWAAAWDCTGCDLLNNGRRRLEECFGLPARSTT